MQVIGAGFGRTGTMSLCAALDQLGYGPCYHMTEVFKNPAHIRVWQAAADGDPVDWRALLGDYPSGLDYPLVAFYEDLMATFPDAKVILTVRDPDRWYDSTLETIYQGAAIPGWLLMVVRPLRGLQAMIDATTWDRLFDGQFEDRDDAIRVFNEHIARVQETVPPERLLTFHVKDGWQPLCDFLGLAVPDGPFPHMNDRQTTQRLYRLARVVSVALPLLLIAVIVGLIMLLS